MADVVVVGASGYTGALAAHLLWRHPWFELRAVTARSDVGRRLDDLQGDPGKRIVVAPFGAIGKRPLHVVHAGHHDAVAQ